MFDFLTHKSADNTGGLGSVNMGCEALRIVQPLISFKFYFIVQVYLSAE